MRRSTHSIRHIQNPCPQHSTVEHTTPPISSTSEEHTAFMANVALHTALLSNSLQRTLLCIKLTILYTRWYKALLSMYTCTQSMMPSTRTLEPCWYRLSTALTSHIYGRQLCGRRTSSAIVQILSPIIHFSHLAAIVQTFVNNKIISWWFVKNPKRGNAGIHCHQTAKGVEE